MKFDPYKKKVHKQWKDKLLDLSIIILNNDDFKNTSQLIESIHKHIKSITYEIIVADNASKEYEFSLLREKHPYIRIIQYQHNLDFAKGNNLGIHTARGNYLLFLSNNTYLDEDNLHYLIETIETENNIGGVCPQIQYVTNNKFIQPDKHPPFTHYSLHNHNIHISSSNEQESFKEIPYLYREAMLIKSEILKHIGYLPEMYHLYYEEFDWSISIRNAGYRIIFDPRCTIHCKDYKNTNEPTPLQIYYLTRNRLLFAYRNYKRVNYIIYTIHLLCIILPRECLFYILQYQTEQLHATLRGTKDYFKLKKKEKLDQDYFKFSYLDN